MDKKIELPKNIIELLEWKNGKWKIDKKKRQPKSVEDHNYEYTEVCGGKNRTDVLFSFLGLYAIGVYIYNKDNDEFKNRFRVSYKIFLLLDDIEDPSSYKHWYEKERILCDKSFLLEIQTKKDYNHNLKLDELNEVFNAFVEVYFKAGNLIPIWPGGNKEKGDQNKGFIDIPWLFFHKYYDWFELLRANKEEAICIDDSFAEYIKNPRFNNLKAFLDDINNIEGYNKYLNECIDIINNRTTEITKNIIKE